MERTYQWDGEETGDYYAIKNLIWILAKLKVLKTDKITWTSGHTDFGASKFLSVTFRD